MFEKLIKMFIKDADNVSDIKVREKYGTLTGIFGIVLNTILSVLKIVVGIIVGAISVVSDGVNNLSDAGSSLITLVGFKLSGKKPDKKHPFGHGRMEYFAGLLVSLVILIVAVELFIGSLKKVINGETISFESDSVLILTIVILSVSILVKCFMSLFYRYAGKKIKSSAITATSLDSISDCISTAVVLVCTILSLFIKSFAIDGVGGLIVSLFIAYTGVRSVIEILDLLLGQAPDKEFVDKIAKYVLSFDKKIVGVHDLMIHDYGPGRKIIVLHAEVPSNGSIMELHDMIDNLERGIENEFNCMATIHLDPVDTESERVLELKNICRKLAKEIDEQFEIHDFRMNEGTTHANVIFDLLITFDRKESKEEIAEMLKDRIKEYDSKLNAVITVDFPLI
ncbi:MAG: cation diffusion facilitator family transporter [Clostridia bacterium]|nr:cation diffusion facilitator family transporter [Clostridia bacterium]